MLCLLENYCPCVRENKARLNRKCVFLKIIINPSKILTNVVRSSPKSSGGLNLRLLEYFH